MKIYFTASIRGKKQYGENYERIVKALEKMGNEVFAKQVLENSEEKIAKEKPEDKVKVYRRLNSMLKRSEAMVAEITAPSVSVGHEISLALEMGKPVLAMYCKGSEPNLLLGQPSDKLHMVAYRLETVTEHLKIALAEAMEKRDVRFNFFVSPEIMAYLEEVSKKRRMPKSVYIRELIEAEMAKEKNGSESD